MNKVKRGEEIPKMISKMKIKKSSSAVFVAATAKLAASTTTVVISGTKKTVAYLLPLQGMARLAIDSENRLLCNKGRYRLPGDSLHYLRKVITNLLNARFSIKPRNLIFDNS